MNDQSKRETTPDETVLDRALLDLMLQTSHPWTEAELARAVSSGGEVPAALARLKDDGLINRWGEFAAASYAALRVCGINHDHDSASAHEHRDESIVLELMLATTDGSRPLSRQELLRELGKSKQKRNRITDAIERLIAAGLLDSSEGMLFLSRAALRYDQLTV
ncbi:MAG: hypothetical protein ABSG93_01110 [Solirubrobacteraceae bacterium]